MDSEVVHSNKKVLLFAAGAVGLIGVLLVLTILSVSMGSDNKPQEAPALPEISEVSNESTAEELNNDVESKSPANNWKEYKNSNFSLSFPPEWDAQDLNFSNGRPGVSIRPVLDENNSANVVLTVNMEPVSFMESFKKQEQMYRALGFKSSSFQLNKIQGTKLSGSLSSKIATPSASQKTIQTSYVVVRKGEDVYVLDYSYTSSGINTQIENTFSKIISTFKFVQ